MPAFPLRTKMICILSTSGLEKVVSDCGAEVSKAMLLIGDRPLCANILDELQARQEFFERILIVGSNLKEFEDWAKFGMHDEFFKTKIIFLRDSNAECLDDDIWAAYDWMQSKDWNSSVLAMRPDIFALDLGKLTDGSVGGFRAYAHGSALNVWKLPDFVEAVNLMVSLNEAGKWSMNELTNVLMERGRMEALDITEAILPLKTRSDYLTAWKSRLSDDGPISCEIDTDRQAMKLSNAWRSKKWSPKIHLVERDVQSRLWDCWDFLESASSTQKPYLQEPIRRGPDVRGEYCNWIELTLIPDASLQAMMMGRKMDAKAWSEILDKALNIMEEEFWEEKEPDWRSDADRKDRAKFLDRLTDKWMDLVREKVPTFSMIKWDTLVRRHLEWMASHVKDRKSVFHNGTGGRLVHGNLTLKDILCNLQTLDIHFTNPVNRTGILVDTFEEYAGLYADCWCLLPVFIKGRHVDYGNKGLDVPDYIAENAYEIESILDARLGDKAIHAKIEALMLALEMLDTVPLEHRKAFIAFLQYRANELYVGSVNAKVALDNGPEPCIGEIGGKEACPKRRLMPMCAKDRKCLFQNPSKCPMRP